MTKAVTRCKYGVIIPGDSHVTFSLAPVGAYCSGEMEKNWDFINRLELNNNDPNLEPGESRNFEAKINWILWHSNQQIIIFFNRKSFISPHFASFF